MSNKPLKISFLSDSLDNWMVPYIKELMSVLEQQHEVKLISNTDQIKTGDILFILSFYKLIPERFLKLNHNNIVVHASKLPAGKGWSPATWQILEGKNEIPLTMFEATTKVDAGDIYHQDVLQLAGEELIQEWQGKMGEKIVEMVRMFINKYPNNISKPQSGKDSFYKRRVPKDSEIDPNKTIAEQFNNFRVADNEKYPVFFKYKGTKYILKIFKALD